MGMMGTFPACANCFLGCASKTGAEKTACGTACGPAVAAAPSPSPVAMATQAGPCTQQQLMSVVTAADPTSAVMGMMGSAPACANCFMGCASKTGAEKTACGMACGGGPAAAAAPAQRECSETCKTALDTLYPGCLRGYIPVRHALHCAIRAQPLHSVAEMVQSRECSLRTAAAPDRRRLRECDAASHSRHVRPERPQEETAVKDRRAGNRHCCACAHFPCEPHWRRHGRAVLIWIRMRFAVTPCR